MLTVVPEFIKAIQAWKEAKEQKPETITLPMRAFLLKQWLEILKNRFEACLASDTSKAQAAEMLVLDANGMVPYLEWDPQAKEMKIKRDREPMRPDQVLEMLTRMQALALQPLAVMRFHAIHKLSWQMSSEVVPMMLEIGGRTPDANRLWEDFGRLSHSAATRCVVTAGQDGEVCPGYRSAEDCRRHVRTLRLQNRGNHCYSHASILSLCWLWTSGPPALADVFGPSLLRVVRWLCTQRGPITLWQNIAWCALHVGWRSPHQQHDVVEYLTYLRPSLGIPLASGRWQSRQNIDNSCLALDEGQTWPLLLPAPLRALAPQGDASLSLQFLIDEWMHSQAGLHGLVTEPLALLLQVNRFVHSPAGISKVEVPVSPEPNIYVPRFANSLDAADPLALQYIRYCRVACILHFGASPSEGHYRAILYDTTLGALITDDGISAARISLEASAAYHFNGYAFIYRLCPVSD